MRGSKGIIRCTDVHIRVPQGIQSTATITIALDHIIYIRYYYVRDLTYSHAIRRDIYPILCDPCSGTGWYYVIYILAWLPREAKERRLF